MNVATLTVLIRGDNRGLRTALGEAERSLSNTSRTMSANMQRTGAIMTGAITAPFVAATAAATRAAVKWESAFTGVIKTVGGVEELGQEAFDALQSGLRDLATSADSNLSGITNAHTEIARIAELAGQLGVDPSEILEFTKVIGELTLATNMTTDSASLMLAQFANITGLDINTELRGLGDVIVHLGNNMATTEADIVHFMQRIAGAANIVGFSETEIAAMAGTLASVGLRAESAGTAMTQLLLKVDESVAGLTNGTIASDELIARRSSMATALLEEQQALVLDVAAAEEAYQRALSGGGGSASGALDRLNNLRAELAEVETQMANNQLALDGLTPGQMINFENAGAMLERYAEIASKAGDAMSAADFAELWQASPDEALTKFFEGLATLESGEQIEALKDLGLQGIRLSDMIRRVAGNVGLLKEAWGFLGEADGALMEEASRRFETTESQWNRLRNILEGVGITIGSVLLPPLNDLLTAASGFLLKLVNLDENTIKWGLAIGAIAAAIGPALIIIVKLSSLFTAIAAVPLASALLSIAGAVGVLVAGFMLLKNPISKVLSSVTKLTFKFAGDALGKVIDAGKGFISTFVTLAGTLRRVFAPSIEIFPDFFEGVNRFLTGIGSGFIRFFYSLETGIRKVTTFMQALGSVLALDFANGGEEALSFAHILERIQQTARATGLDFIAEFIDLFTTNAIENTQLFKFLFGETATLESVKLRFQEIAGKIVEGVKAGLQFGVDVWNGLKTSFQTFIDTFVTDGKIDWNKLGEAISKKIQEAWNKIKTFDYGTFLTNAKDKLIESITNSEWYAVAQEFVTSVEQELAKIDTQAIVQSIKNWFIQAFLTVKNKISDVVASVPAIAQAIFDWLKEAINKIVSSDLGVAIQNKIKEAIKFVEGKIATIDLDTIKTEVTNKLLEIKDSLVTFYNQLTSESIIDQIVGAFEGLTGIEIPTALMDSIRGFVTTLSGLFAVKVLSGDGGLLGGLKGLATFFTSKGGAKLASKFTTLFNVFKGAAIPVTLVVATIGGLANRLPELGESIRQFIANASQGDWKTVVALISGIATAISTLVGLVGDLIAKGIIAILPQLGTAIAGFTNIIGGLLNVGDAKGYTQLKDGVVGLLSGVATSIGLVSIGVLQSFVDLLSLLLSAVGVDTSGLDDVNTFFEELSTALAQGAVKAFLEEVVSLIDKVLLKLNSLVLGLELALTKVVDIIPGVNLTARVDFLTFEIDHDTAEQNLREAIETYLATGIVTNTLYDFASTGQVVVDSVDGTVGVIELDTTNLTTVDLTSITENLDEILAKGPTLSLGEVSVNDILGEKALELQAEFAAMSTVEYIFDNAENLGNYIEHMQFIQDQQSKYPALPLEMPVNTALDIANPEEMLSNLWKEEQSLLTTAVTPEYFQTVLIDPDLANEQAFAASIYNQSQSTLDAQVFDLAANAHLNITVGSYTIAGIPTTLGGAEITVTPEEHQTGGMASYTGLHLLHEGEEVLTRGEARRYRSGENGGGNTIIINGNQDVDTIINELARRGIYL